MIARPITLTGDEVGEAMRAVHLTLMGLNSERWRYIDRRLPVPESLVDRIARLEALDKRLSAATDGKDA